MTIQTVTDIVSFRFTQRNNLIVLAKEYDYTDFINKKEKMCFRGRRTSVAVGFP